MHFSFLSLLLLGNGALGRVVRRFPSSSYQLKEHHNAPRAWTRIGAAPPEHVLSVRIGLTQGRFSELERNLYEGMILANIKLYIIGLHPCNLRN